MFEKKNPHQFIPGVATFFMDVYENKAAAELAVEQSLNNYLHKELSRWLKKVKIKKQGKCSKEGSPLKLVNPEVNLLNDLPDYFNKGAKKIVKECFKKKFTDYKGIIESDSFDEDFVKKCVEKLKEAERGLFYQGSSAFVFYKDGRHIRALKPDIDHKHGLNAEANKNLRMIGSENQFNERFVEKVTPCKVYAPRIIDIKENQIIWGDRQGVLIVYEKEEGKPVGREIYNVLDELIKETKPKEESNSISNLRPNVNLASAISKLQDVVSRTKGLRSCQLYIINEKKNQVIKSDLKTKTLDPINDALLDSEKMKEIRVESILSTNYHFKALFNGLARIFLANLWTATLFIIITGVCLIASAITYSPIFFVCGVLAFIVGLGVISYRSNQSIDRLLEETKPTKEYEKEILTELDANRIAAFSLKELSKLESTLSIDNKEDKQLSLDKVLEQDKKQSECNEKSKSERQDAIKLSQEAKPHTHSLSKIKNRLKAVKSDYQSRRENKRNKKIERQMYSSDGKQKAQKEKRKWWPPIKQSYERKIGIRVLTSCLSTMKNVLTREAKKITLSSMNPLNKKCELQPFLEQDERIQSNTHMVNKPSNENSYVKTQKKSFFRKKYKIKKDSKPKKTFSCRLFKNKKNKNNYCAETYPCVDVSVPKLK